MRAFKTMLTAAAAMAAALPAAASAQFGGVPTGVPLPYPSPLDAMRGEMPPRIGACGLDEGWNGLRVAMQEAYEKAGRCEEYDPGLWDAYVRGKPSYRRTFAGYFAEYGLGWWDGTVPPARVRAEAEVREDYEAWLVRPCASKKCAREKVAARDAYVAWRSAGRPDPVATAASAVQADEGRQGTAVEASQSELGACGLPARSPQGRAAQETLAREGTCEVAKSYMRASPTPAPAPHAEAASTSTVGACGAPVPDALAGDVQRLLHRYGGCGLYTESRYAAYAAEVPADHHYAVNYLAWIADEPLVPPTEAAMLDAQELR